VGHMEEKRNVYRLLVGKSEGKRPLGRPRCSRWIILSLIDRIGWRGLDWYGSGSGEVEFL
jgi:hypothetical protein